MKNNLTENQIELGAKWLTLCNLGQEPKKKPKNESDLQAEYKNCIMVHSYEGIDISDEYESWEKDLRKSKENEFCITEIKKDLPWLFN